MKAILFLLSLVLVSCSARIISVEANPNLDPKPVMVGETKAGLDPLEKDQWNLKKIGSDIANQVGSKRVKVALLGTGVDYTHEDLVGSIFVNRNEWTELTPGRQDSVDGVDNDKNGYVDDFIGYDFVENDGLPFDRNGAGTAMAGVLGATTQNGIGISGIVKDVSIVPVRFIDGSGHFLIPNLFKALKYAVVAGVDVVLLHTPSYVFGESAAPPMRESVAKMEKQMLHNLLAQLKSAGIPVIASAGHSGAIVDKNTLISELALIPNVIVVTSVDQEDKRPFIANFSREKVHTSAPGKDILTTSPGNRYEVMSGTNLAAAHVAGALALAVNQTHGRNEIRRLVEGVIRPEASDPLESLRHETIGGNRLNIAKYLKYISGI